MKADHKIGVVGVGVVGTPLLAALKYYHKDVKSYDKYQPSDNWEDILKTDIVFLCLPTDKGEDGRLNMDVVDEVLGQLDAENYDGLVVIKSTLRLGYITEAYNKFNLKLAVFPEWLYANNAFPGTLRPEMTVIGTYEFLDDEFILDVCCWHKNDNAHVMRPEEAVMLKLTANAYASTKISFANQIMMICDKYDLDHNLIMKMFKHDPRNVDRYLTPGWAYGGYCLPKDTSELACSIDDEVLFTAVEEINERVKKWKKSE